MPGFRYANTFRRHIEGPSQDESDGKPGQQQDNEQPLRPVRQLPRRKDRRCNLNDASGNNDVGNRNAINLSPLHLLEKAAHKNVVHWAWPVVSASAIDNYAHVLLKLNDFAVVREGANYHE